MIHGNEMHSMWVLHFFTDFCFEEVAKGSSPPFPYIYLSSLPALLSLFGTRRHQVQTNRSERAPSLRLSWSPRLHLCLLLCLEPHRGLPCGICNCCCCCFCYTWLLLLLLSTHLNTNAFVQKTPTVLRQVDEGTLSLSLSFSLSLWQAALHDNRLQCECVFFKRV